MQIIKKKTNKAEIQLSLHEISALTQVFNYMAGAVRLDNFEQVIGVSQEKSGDISDYFQYLRNRIDPSTSVVKNIINKKICNLRTQKYDLCFYMQKIPTKRENVKFGTTLQKKGTKEIIVKTLWNTISITQIRQDLILLKDKANSFDDKTDTVSFSMFNEAVEISITNSKLKESDSVEKPQLDIEFVFPRGIEFSDIDSDNTPETKKEIPFDSPKSFSSTVTLENITNFITKVEDFFDNKVNNNLN